MPIACEADWRSRVASSPFRAAVSFEGDDLVLGSGTVLYKLGIPASGTISLNADTAHDRMVALLAIAGRGRVAKAALAQLAAAFDDWRRGDRGLAAIRLAFAPLPRLRDLDEAYSLFLAETALDAGLSPNDLLKELGYAACTPLLKFDPAQPRVPAGSGTRSGQWTSGNSPGGASDTASAPAASRPMPASRQPAPGAAETIRPMPVFLSPSDPDEHDIEDKWRRLGIGETEEQRAEEGRPLPRTAPGAVEVAPPSSEAPGSGNANPTTPDTNDDQAPRSEPGPAEGGGSPGDDTPDQNGPACPEQQNDRPHGQNANANAFEYLMSLIVNPLNPTPKQSAATPNVVSQSYYLPSPTPDGKTSYDDCKQDDTPISIPGVNPGDMFEYKSANFGWQMDYTNSQGYQKFYKQVSSQNAGVVAEGLGRQVYYCMGSQAYADKATALLHVDFPNSHFLVCH